MKCLAYLITFRTYGSWLPGDERGFVDHARLNHGATQRDFHSGLHRAMLSKKKHETFVLAVTCRACIEKTIREVAAFKSWIIHAVSIRTNHVHLVVSANDEPEKVLNAFKSWTARRLREDGYLPPNLKLWARHGSMKYLWDNAAVEAACRYVVEGQGDDISA